MFVLPFIIIIYKYFHMGISFEIEKGKTKIMLNCIQLYIFLYIVFQLQPNENHKNHLITQMRNIKT